MILLLFTSLAAAAFGPVDIGVTGQVGMRVGGQARALVAPVPWVEVGGAVGFVRDLTAGAPDWVTDGLTVHQNGRLSPLALAGVRTPGDRWQAALLGGVGFEVLRFSETRAIRGRDPASYETTELAAVGGLLAEGRWRPTDRLGVHLSVWLPLPFSPTGAPDIERAWGGLGLSWKLGTLPEAPPQ